MKKKAKQTWSLQLMGCQRKGKEAFERGESRDSCPYIVRNPWGYTGPRNLTRQRKQYWLFGYDTAAGTEANEPH